jgi:hypothetical protein
MAVVTLLTRLETTIQVDYGQFFLIDAERQDGFPLYGDDWPVHEWFHPAAVGAGLMCWGEVHWPKITVEVWDGPPPPVDWERTETREVYLPSRRARLMDLMHESVSEVWEVPRERMRLRASTRGREAIWAAVVDTENWPPRDIEEWLLQFY